MRKLGARNVGDLLGPYLEVVDPTNTVWDRATSYSRQPLIAAVQYCEGNHLDRQLVANPPVIKPLQDVASGAVVRNGAGQRAPPTTERRNALIEPDLAIALEPLDDSPVCSGGRARGYHGHSQCAGEVMVFIIISSP
jgi:hypothetical protein